MRGALLLALLAAVSSQAPKLIISVLIDDLGFHDLGYTGSRILTPHLDRLRGDGAKLTSFYVQPICTPTRSSFLTNRLPLALGLQGKQTVQQGCNWGLDVEEQTFVEALAAGGYYYGAEDYFTHLLGGSYDLRNDTGRSCGPGCSQAVGPAHNGTYSPFMYAPAVVRLIESAAATGAPTYIHFTPQSVHAPNEAPEPYVAPYRAVFGPSNPVRAVHAGALACLDEAIGNITAAIAAAGLGDDTLILLSADNGGPLGPSGDGTMASNYPLRGGKHTLYQGGVLAEAFAWGPRWFGRPAGNATWGGLAHVSDVGLTILDAAGVAPLPPKPGREVHGVSFWGPLTAGGPSNRSALVVNIDYTVADGTGAAGAAQNYAQAALVAANGWKLLLGNPAFPELDYWSDENGEPLNPPPALSSAPLAPVGAAGALAGASPLWPLANMTPSLYNITQDPRETQNLAGAHPDVVAAMLEVLAAWGARAVPVVENGTVDPASNPKKYFNGSWTPWLGL